MPTQCTAPSAQEARASEMASEPKKQDQQSPVESDTASIKISLTPTQMFIIGRGLNFIVASHLERQRGSSLNTTYPFMIRPLPPGKYAGTFSQKAMDQMIALWNRIKPRAVGKNVGGRIQMNWLDVRMAILAARVGMGFRRKSAREKRETDPAVRENWEQVKRDTQRLQKKTKRTIRSLECYRKRADRAFRKNVSREEYLDLAKQWQAHARWIHYYLAYFTPWVNADSGIMKLRRMIIEGVLRVAEQSLRSEGYAIPPTTALRKIVRLYIRYCRQGRIAEPTFKDILDRNKYFDQVFLAEFIARRLKLKRVSPRKIPGIGYGGPASKTKSEPAVAISGIGTQPNRTTARPKSPGPPPRPPQAPGGPPRMPIELPPRPIQTVSKSHRQALELPPGPPRTASKPPMNALDPQSKPSRNLNPPPFELRKGVKHTREELREYEKWLFKERERLDFARGKSS